MIERDQVFQHAAPQLHDYLIDSARRLPEKVALVCGRERLTYAEIDARSNALASALVRRGVVRGDRVLVFADNTSETVIAFWAVLKANAVVSVVNSETKTEKLLYLLHDSQAAALIADARHMHVFADAAARSPSLRTVVVSGLNGLGQAARLPGAVTWDEALAAEPGDRCPPRRNLDIDLAALIYTSGSTGEPKGVMLTHRNMLAAATSITAYLENVADDVILGVLPLSFDYGLYQMIMAFKVGARLVLERSFAFPAQVLQTVVSEGVTGFPGVPTMFAMMAGMPTLCDHDFSKVRYVTNTAAALPVRHVQFLKELFPTAKIYSMYGLTECKRCTYLPPEDLERKPTSVGIAIPNTEIWTVDDRGNRLGPGQTGQLVVRGATVMRGYWGKPELTAARLRPGPLPGELVLYTGDSCRFDEDGYLYFVGRTDDMINTRGEKVSPLEVERALAEIPGVREAAVVGVPDPVLGEAVRAFVVQEEGAGLTEAAIRVACLSRLESFMVPQEVVLLPELPKTETGKVLKRVLVRER